MRFTLATVAAILATASFTAGRAIDLTSRSYDGLYVQLCGGGIAAGEDAFIYLGDGVGPYTLTAVDMNGTYIQDIASDVTVSRYHWFTTPTPPVGSQFKVNVTDSTGAQAQTTAITVGEHPGRK